MFAIVLTSVFVAAMVGIGFWGMSRTRTLGDFFLGGRSVGPWMSAIAYGTTYFSAVVFIGFAGKLGWGFGPRVLLIAAGNTLFGSMAAWMVLGRRTRSMTQSLGAMTMPEFLSERFGAGYLKTAAALIIFVFLLPYSASIFKGLGHLFEAVFGISYDLALLIMIVITGIYLVLGGYFAIAATDFVQGLIMIVGSILMVAVLLGKAGGLGEALNLAATRYAQHVPPGKQPSLALLAGLVFMTSFGTWGLPQMVQKFYAVKDVRVIRTATWVTTAFAAVIVFAAYFTGVLSHVFFDAPPVVGGKVDFDRLIPTMLKQQLPDPLLAVILLLVLSASMSTLSSLVLVSASAIAIDLYKARLAPQDSSGKPLALIRVLSGAFVLFSFVIARYEIEVIVTLMSLSWGVVAGAFMAPFLYGLYWERATTAGVAAGMTTGAALGVALFFVLGPANSPIAASIAMIVPFAVVPLVSAVTAPPAAALIDRAFADIGSPVATGARK